MAIDARHSQYAANEDKWQKINDVLEEENLENYLIELNPKDKSDLNKNRNAAYKERAVFYALAGQTASGMLGTVYAKPPTIDVPDGLEYILKNIDGRGNSITQQSKSAMGEVISKSRDGLFVTFPVTDGGISKADITSGKYVASTQEIPASRIINWAESSFGAKIFLSLVVFKDNKQVIEDYIATDVNILRELYIDEEDGFYKERHWIKNDDKWEVDEVGVRVPVDYKGNKMPEIPFTFVGAENNDSDVDKPVMNAMCTLNIAHYRNSADFEDSAWFAGQPQPWMSGVDQEHINLMKENDMYVGSRNVLAVPDDGAFGIETAPANPIIRQAMIDKVDMMIGIGARMITPGGVAKTAEQSSNERETQHSMLSLAVENVSSAYVKCIEWMGWYMGVETADVVFELNSDFVKIGSTPAELKEVVTGFVAGTVPLGDYVSYMKKYGLFDEEKTIDDYAESIRVPTGGEE